MPVTYGEDGDSRPSACFGGAPDAVATLRARTWRGSREPRREPKVTLTWPRAPEGQRFDRAAGLHAGDGDRRQSRRRRWSSSTAETIRAAYPSGVRDLGVSPVWHTLAGSRPTTPNWGWPWRAAWCGWAVTTPEDAAAAYGRWYASAPFDCGHTTARAFAPAASAAAGSKAHAARNEADRDSQSNGSLMRIAPIGVWAATPDEAAATASADFRAVASASGLPRRLCFASPPRSRPLCRGARPARDDRNRPADRRRGRRRRPLRSAPPCARPRPAWRPADFQHQMGWVLIALQNAFYHLAAGTAVEPALIETVGQGGDTDTNAAIAGALLGAADGRASLPVRWVLPVLTCRPDPGCTRRGPDPTSTGRTTSST